MEGCRSNNRKLRLKKRRIFSWFSLYISFLKSILLKHVEQSTQVKYLIQKNKKYFFLKSCLGPFKE